MHETKENLFIKKKELNVYENTQNTEKIDRDNTQFMVEYLHYFRSTLFAQDRKLHNAEFIANDNSDDYASDECSKNYSVPFFGTRNCLCQ